MIDNFTGQSKLFEFRYENNNIHNSTAFDELERFISIYNPSETIFIHNYEKPYKIHDIINFIGLNSDKIHSIYLSDDTELSKQARTVKMIIFKKNYFSKFLV